MILTNVPSDKHKSCCSSLIASIVFENCVFYTYHHSWSVCSSGSAASFTIVCTDLSSSFCILYRLHFVLVNSANWRISVVDIPRIENRTNGRLEAWATLPVESTSLYNRHMRGAKSTVVPTLTKQ